MLPAAIALTMFCGLQEGSLDVLDGETLYEDGWLHTASVQLERREGLRQGRSRVSDPLDRRIDERSLVLASHYGLRNNIQVSAILPWRQRALTLDDPAGPDRYSVEGLGDAALVAKWRYYRWDDTGIATNFAVLGGLELPTGREGAGDHGVELGPELQPGGGSWNPSVGLAVTHEPMRWRFNAALLYQRHGTGSDGFRSGDQVFAELAAGNRFWLEPYPGPFMRLDVFVRHRSQGRAGDHGETVDDSGGQRLTAGATWAFRPRPTLDFQLNVEVPLRQSLHGTQLEEDSTILFVFGYRM